MAQLTLHLQLRPAEKVRLAVYFVLHSDDDTTPREHEREHRRIIQSVLPQVDFNDECGERFVIERAQQQGAPMLGSDDCSGYEVIDVG